MHYFVIEIIDWDYIKKILFGRNQSIMYIDLRIKQ